MGGTEPTACKNSPIFRAKHTPVIPHESRGVRATFGEQNIAEKKEGGSGGRGRDTLNSPTLLLRRRKAGGRAASSASRTCQQERSSGATGGRRCHLARSTAVTQAAAPAQALSLGCLSVCLGVAWSPRPDTCAQRDGCSVEWLASHPRGLRRYWSARASWAGASSNQRSVRLQAWPCFSLRVSPLQRRGNTQVQNSPFRNAPGRAEQVCFVLFIRSYKQKVIMCEVIKGEQLPPRPQNKSVLLVVLFSSDYLTM